MKMTKEKKDGKEELTNDIRVSLKIWGFLYNVANDVRVMTGRRCTPNEILTANKQNITAKAVLEMRKRQEEKERPPVADDGDGDGKERKRKSLLEVAIEVRKEKEKKKGVEEWRK